MNEKFKVDIENIKRDLAIEGMCLSQEDVDLLQKYSSREINMEQLINTIQKTTMEGIQ